MNDRRMEQYVRITDRLFYDPNEREFFHSTKDGDPCIFFCPCPICDIKASCIRCGYEPSDEEQFIIKLGWFGR
jgi:hypothetical protein